MTVLLPHQLFGIVLLLVFEFVNESQDGLQQSTKVVITYTKRKAILLFQRMIVQ
jgi:hypothetical protein